MKSEQRRTPDVRGDFAHTVSDPMSGYFVLTRAFFDEVPTRSARSASRFWWTPGVGEAAAARRRGRLPVPDSRPWRVEARYRRGVGVSGAAVRQGHRRLDSAVVFLFGLVGTAGMAFNFVAAALLLRVWDLEFFRAQAIGALLTVAVNFFLNNAMTFRFARMRGAGIVDRPAVVLRRLLGGAARTARRRQRSAAVRRPLGAGDAGGHRHRLRVELHDCRPARVARPQRTSHLRSVKALHAGDGIGRGER